MVFLITGIGTLGSALTKTLIRKGHKVRSYSRNEHHVKDFLSTLTPEEASRYSPIIGAVENLDRLRRACAKVDCVIHTAAMKRVDLVEYNPVPAIRTNIDGTINVIEACLDCGVNRALLISSDKARAPSTLYGATKLVGERLWLAANRYRGPLGAVFSVAIYGNVWGSEGSVMHEWRNQAKQDGQLTLTDPHMTRFHITIPQAVNFVVRATQEIKGERIWIPKLPTYQVKDLAMAFCEVFNLNYEKNVKIIGRRPTEKIHEELITENESPYVCHEDDWHFELDYRAVSQEGGWKYCSASKQAKRLPKSELVTMVRNWLVEIGDPVCET